VSTARFFSALAGGAARRPRLVLALSLALALAAAALALRLHPSAATSTFVSSSSREYRDTQSFYERFGEEPVQVLVKGDLQQLVLSDDLERLLGMEGCISGNVPASALAREGGRHGPCAQLARARTVKVVFGPGTFVNEAANEIDEGLATQAASARAQAAEAERAVRRAALARGLSPAQASALGKQASRITTTRFQEGVVALALQYGLTARPSLADRNFVSTLVFDPSKPAGTPKQRFAYLFPSRDAALVSVRMRAGLSESQRTHTIGLIRAAVAMPQWRPQHGESYLVTGEPVIVADLTHSITSAIELLLVAVLVVMAATLGLIFFGRPRLLPLALALLATALTFAALSLAGGSLAIAQVAVLPVLVGLSVDYAIQFQARVHEQQPPADAGGARVEAIGRAASLGAPTIAAAAAASAAAMLVLLLSPVPMVQGFGVLLVAGVAIALACALTAGAAALALPVGRAPAPSAAGGARRMMAGLGARVRALAERRLAPSWRGARELLLEGAPARQLRRAALVEAVQRPRAVLLLGLALAALGWGLDTQARVETDITKLVPQSLGSLQNLSALERATGVGGEIDLMVSGANVASPSTIEWMSSYQRTMLARFGYSAARGCGRARLCPAFSLPDLFAGQAPGIAPPAKSAPAKLTQAQVSALLAAIPPYFAQDVITPDHRAATLAFGIRLMGLDEQQHLIEAMRARVHPPRGVHAALVGLPVLAAASGTQVSSPWRRLETLIAGLVAVALVLLIAFRGEVRRALVPLVPVALASGWSALVLAAVRIPLNPMSVTLGALVIAISTEFSVLLSERYREELATGHDPVQALERSYRRTGAAVLASGVTAIMGFGVLALSDISMLRDFGLATLVDLSVSLAGVMVALPAALVLAAAPSARLDRGRRSLPRALGGRRLAAANAPPAAAPAPAGPVTTPPASPERAGPAGERSRGGGPEGWSAR
jgi:hydrophobe/amphiphile efflux-3 (HAE3) family protein